VRINEGDDCQLTPSDFHIITALIKGEAGIKRPDEFHDFYDVYEIWIPRDKCPECGGSGRSDKEHTFEGNTFFGQCPTCDGTGVAK
jgi:excinuclease UvrABC ATPase subunit